MSTLKVINLVHPSGGSNTITIDTSGNISIPSIINSTNIISSNVAITAANTLSSSAFGKLHQCSGTTSDYTVTLPAVSGNAGKVIGFQMSTALTKLVTLDGNASETIDGSLTRIMWAGESAILYCDGTTWSKIDGKSIPMTAGQTVSGAQTVGSGTATKKTLGTSYASNCPSAMNDTTNSKIIILRPSVYNIISSSRIFNISATTSTEGFIYIDGAEQGIVSRYSGTGDYPTVQVNMNYTLNANQYIENYVRQYSGVNQSYGNNNMNSLFVTEILQW